jgi:adenosylhomocysteine nucleosidase
MLFILVALTCEAKPLIKHFCLKKVYDNSPFPIYQKDDIFLIISGIGKKAVMCALAFLAGFTKQNGIWLNIGIAGHPSLERGTLLMASKIMDEESKEIYYPTFLERYPLIYSPVITVQKQEIAFNSEAAYDMEASAFFYTALFFATSEMIHSLKIISDNKMTPFNKNDIPTLIEKNIPQINFVISSLKKLIKKAKPAYDLMPFLSHAHFSETEAHQLKKALQQLNLNRADEILSFLRQHVSTPLY